MHSRCQTLQYAENLIPSKRRKICNPSIRRMTGAIISQKNLYVIKMKKMRTNPSIRRKLCMSSKRRKFVKCHQFDEKHFLCFDGSSKRGSIKSTKIRSHHFVETTDIIKTSKISNVLISQKSVSHQFVENSPTHQNDESGMSSFRRKLKRSSFRRKLEMSSKRRILDVIKTTKTREVIKTSEMLETVKTSKYIPLYFFYLYIYLFIFINFLH